MKGIKTLIGIALATTTLGGAIAVGATATTKINNSPVNVAEAATNKTFYIDCGSVDGWDSESLCLHTWNGSKDVYAEATKAAEDYWYVTIDTTGCSGYRWYRCAPGNTGTRWNESGWNGNLTSNYCAIKGWDSNATFSTVSDNGAGETYEVASTTPSSATKRIWVDPKDNFYDGNARAALRTFNGSTAKKTYILGGSSQYVTVGGNTLFYVDIPKNDDCQLVRLHNAFNYIWTYGGNFSDIGGYNTAKIVYSWDAAADYSADNESSPTVAYAKKVLDGYSTCESSSVNGYGCYSNINTQILSKLSASNLSSLRSATFTAETYGSRTYGEKIDRMASSGGLGSRVIGNTTTNSTSVIMIVGVGTLILTATAALYFFLRKKKEQ